MDTTGVWNPTTDWTFANATTIEFNTAPPDAGFGPNIRIFRNTDVENMVACLIPVPPSEHGLNDNFQQLQSAIQENKCGISDPLHPVMLLLS